MWNYPAAGPVASSRHRSPQIPTLARELTRIPKDTVDLDSAAASSVLKLMERLDDHDDVQNVSANFNIPDEVMASLDAE